MTISTISAISAMRQSTLQTLGLGTALEIFRNGRLPASARDLVDEVFGKVGDRGALVISGANGIVGAGKAMQLGSRLEPFGVPILALDFPGASDGMGRHYPGLAKTFGREGAARIMENIIRMSYNGLCLPQQLKGLKPRFLLEAIPEILDAKKAHYKLFRSAFPELEIRSVTSGFPSSELGVGIAHPAFPHEISKIWEMVESNPSSLIPHPSPIPRLFWALGMIPVPVSDNWSFVLDVLFCGATLAALRYHQASNMPYWKIDKYFRKLLGANPFRAHDAIGAKGANFLTWSCLHHLKRQYGALFEPNADLNERKDTGQEYYPLNHFRPLVNWSFGRDEEEDFKIRILGPLFQMTSLILHEKRSHLAHVNAIGELCAQFRRGILAVIRGAGYEAAMKIVKDYHKLHPQAKKCWYPEAFEQIGTPEWQQLYVNAEHNGRAGIITVSRESYNSDVDAELNRAIDWLAGENIERVIITGDFHLSTQMVGADTADFYPALSDVKEGLRISGDWSRTARRLHDDFKVSVGFIGGKRCFGGFLELLMHCHYLVSVEEAGLGMPEVTLPVVPGMEGCHWPFRKTAPEKWPGLLRLLLSGSPVRAKEAVGRLVDYAGPIDKCLQTAWKIVTGADHNVARRKVKEAALKKLPKDLALPDSENNAVEAGRKAIFECIQASCAATSSEALLIQAKHSAGFMASPACRTGRIGAELKKTMEV
ncbi:MAG: enoyl-CoA hydratase/isomerase family protein [Elusimicrobia bacterium]|nr:enoyl-CoA hydratase/isomerase family protein [Elusimicrobiota bacterium]